MARIRSLGWSACALVALLAGSASIANAQDCDGWVALHEIMPRKNPVMLSTGGSTAFLFGGSLGGQSAVSQDINTATSETWEFDGTRWRFTTLRGPSPRALTAAAFDSARRKVVLFGGMAINSNSGFPASVNETWEYADGVWSQRTPAHAPAARYGHAMVYDPSRNLTFLYGGLNSSVGLFWAFDGNDWTEVPLPSQNPGIQSNHRLVFDPRDSSIVLIPYSSASAVWKWDGSAWSSLAPTQVQMTSAFFDATLNTFILTSQIGQFYTYNGSSAAQQVVGLPPGSPGSNFPTAVPTAQGWLTVIGPLNSTTPVANQYRVSVAHGWAAIPTRPQPNATQEMAFDYHAPTHEFVLFGGSRIPNVTPVLAETWLLRGERWHEFTGAEPPARLSGQLAFSPHRGASLLLGGTPSTQVLWSWTGSGWTSAPTGNVSVTPGTPPDFDGAHDAIVWPIGTGVAVIDEVTTPFSVPSISTMNGAAAFDPVRGFVFAGGQNSTGTYRLVRSGATFTWQFVSLGSPASPSSWGPRMAFDPDRGGLVYFGGFSTIASGDVNSFPRRTYFLGSGATAWTALPLQFGGPIGRKFQAMAYDPVARRIVMYGGLTHGSAAPLQETWKLARGPAAIALEPDDTYIVPGDTAEVFIIASGGGVIEYQWFKDGTPLANSARITGADTDTLQIQSFTADDNGEYHVTVHNPCGDDQSITVQVRAIPSCPGDFDDSGTTDANDLAAFFSVYERGLMLADVDLSGGIDANDVAVFMASYEVGGC